MKTQQTKPTTKTKTAGKARTRGGSSTERNIKTKKRIFLEALEKSLGVISKAVQMSGVVDRRTVYRWIEDDEDFAQAVHAVGETACDFVESKLFQLIEEGNPQAVIFFAKTRMKHRGYTERMELTGSGGHSLFEGLSDNDLDKRIRELQAKTS